MPLLGPGYSELKYDANDHINGAINLTDKGRAFSAGLVSQVNQVAINGGKLNWSAVAADGLTAAVAFGLESNQSNRAGGGINLSDDTGQGVVLNSRQRGQFFAGLDDAINTPLQIVLTKYLQPKVGSA